MKSLNLSCPICEQTFEPGQESIIFAMATRSPAMCKHNQITIEASWLVRPTLFLYSLHFV